eukprot:TRINITY_DN28_c0_g1_i7.p1 TRINITY_DN28_c0_g1~~TRINITY_DN28_c0_g1_i7.p1  ORF type:complete len:431 (-),score=136.79 TRINITY_DN28_c0_g1_i7:186-1478(-)
MATDNAPLGSETTPKQTLPANDNVNGEPLVLGFVRKFEEDDYDFNFRWFSSKVGGKPAWLVPENLPNRSQLTCGVCEGQLSFLLQLYGPLSAQPSAYHRQMYVFCCKKGECHKNASSSSQIFKVFRAQIPKENPFYDEEVSELDEEEEGNDRLIKAIALVCELCGQAGDKRCGGCRHVRYCSKQHQLDDWNLGHDVECKDWKECSGCKSALDSFYCQRRKEWGRKLYDTSPSASPSLKALQRRRSPFLFEEFKVFTEDEDEEEVRKKEKEVEEKMEQLKLLSIKEGNFKEKDDEDEDGEEEEKKEDKVFTVFQKKIAVYPDQILRYYLHKGVREPEWVTTKGRPKAGDIPPCPSCSSPRVLEFQILPQLLYFLNVDEKKDVTAIDWATLVIYTCKNSCSPAPSPSSPSPSPYVYHEEFLWRQCYDDSRVV